MTDRRWLLPILATAACTTKMDPELLEETVPIAEEALLAVGFRTDVGPLVTFEVKHFEGEPWVDGECQGPYKDGRYEIRIADVIDSAPVEIVLHELGHALGLQHTDAPGNVMNGWVSGRIGFDDPIVMAQQLAAACERQECSEGLTFGEVKR